jgi:alkylhydroperoxidase family enzyme
VSDIRSRLSVLGSRRYVDDVTLTTHAVLESDGETTPQVRWAIFHDRDDEIPAALRTYVSKVRLHAYKVTDDDVEALKRAGYSEDAIFEVTASASLGAAILRLERGLIALNEGKV